MDLELRSGCPITKADDPSHKQKASYSLTEPAIELVPMMARIGGWGSRHLPVTEELSIRAKRERLSAMGCSAWKRRQSNPRRAVRTPWATKP